MVRGRGHNVVIIGAGSIGERHLRCFAATGRADVGFVEIQPELRQRIATQYPQARAFTSLEQALESPPDIAVIATPAPLHVPQAIHLAERGVHVLIEKPLSVSMEGVARLVDTVARAHVTAAVAYVYRAHPALASMREAIAAGRFGCPLQIVAVSGQCFPHYRPGYRNTYYARREHGGGAIQDALTHVTNAGEWLVGPITRLAADAGHKALEGVEVEDTVHVLTRQGEVMGSYSLNQHQAPNETTITVVCERGTARFETHKAQWIWMEKPEQEWREECVGPLERDALFVRQANEFLDAVEGKRAPACPLSDGVQTLKVNLAILCAADRGTWETVS
jgi:predicted dehydrogenase